jgi:hypothetical protein
MYLLQVFVVNLLHSPHSNYNLQKSQSHFGATLNARKLDNHSFILSFHLGQHVIFSSIVHFIHVPHPFHDGLAHIHPCGNNYF